MDAAVGGAGADGEHDERLGGQPVEPLAGGHRLPGLGVVAEAAPVALGLDRLVRDRPLDDEHERLQLAALGLEEPLDERVGALVRAASKSISGQCTATFGSPGNAPSAISSMLGWVAAVRATESPSQLNPALIQRMWTVGASVPAVVDMAVASSAHLSARQVRLVVGEDSFVTPLAEGGKWTAPLPTRRRCAALRAVRHTGAWGRVLLRGNPRTTDGWRAMERSALRQLAAIAAVQVLVMATWFSASAVVPALRAEWQLTAGGAVWLTASVQLGFVTGAVTAAVLNLADRVPAHRLVAVCALLAAARDGLRRGVRRRPRGGGAAAVPHRCRPRGGLPDRPEAHDVVVRPRTRIRPRRAGRRPDAGQRAPPADQRLRRAAVAGGAAGGGGERRGGRRCSRRASSVPARWPRPPRRSGRGTR